MNDQHVPAKETSRSDAGDLLTEAEQADVELAEPELTEAEQLNAKQADEETDGEENNQADGEQAESDTQDPDEDATEGQAETDVTTDEDADQDEQVDSDQQAQHADDNTTGEDAPVSPPVPTGPRVSAPTPNFEAPAKPGQLNIFFDELDERLTIWWENRDVRRARKIVLKRRAAAQAEVERAEKERQAAEAEAAQASTTPASGNAEVPVGPDTETAENDLRPLAPFPVPLDGTGAKNHAPQSGAPTTPRHQQKPKLSPEEQRRRELILQKASAIEASYDSSAQQQVSSDAFADEEEDLYTYIPPYNLPSRDPNPTPTALDRARQIVVSVAALAAVISAGWMLGIGVESPTLLSQGGATELANGWFSGEHALLSPGAQFYWLWPVIAVTIVLYAIHQWSATQHSAFRQRRAGWALAGASGLMLLLTASIQHGWLSVGAGSALLITLLLVAAIREFTIHTARSTTERRLSDDVVGMFLGFSLVQLMSFLSIWLTDQGWHVPAIPALLWAMLGLVACVWIAAYYAMTERGRSPIAMGLAWGMLWLVFPRLFSDASSVWVAIAAAMGAFIVILSTQSRRHRINHAERRAAMGRPLEDII